MRRLSGANEDGHEEPAHAAAARSDIWRPSRSDCHVSRRVVSLARTTATREKVRPPGHSRRAAEVRSGARGFAFSGTCPRSRIRRPRARPRIRGGAERATPSTRSARPAPGTARRKRWRSRRVAGAPERRARATGDGPLRRAHPTAGIHVFRGDQDLRVPVPERRARSPRRRRRLQIARALDRRPRERHGRRLHVRRGRAPRHGPLARGASCVFPS